VCFSGLPDSRGSSCLRRDSVVGLEIDTMGRLLDPLLVGLMLRRPVVFGAVSVPHLLFRHLVPSTGTLVVCLGRLWLNNAEPNTLDYSALISINFCYHIDYSIEVSSCELTPHYYMGSTSCLLPSPNPLLLFTA
jgi:hypothetical protein